MPITDYQHQRVQDVQHWYEDVYCALDGHVPESIRYMALWAVFNALYNIADYPKVTLKTVSSDEGKIRPYIRGRDDDKKLRFIARKLSQDSRFVESVFQNHSEFITYLSQRTPEVQQPPDTKTIQFEHNYQKYTINLSDLHGIASIDNRFFLPDGKVLFQYHYIDLDLSQDNLPKDARKFFLQLLNMLYQLRNNIVHGGSAAYIMQKVDLSTRAISLLDDIILYLFAHPELLDQDGE